MVPCVPQPCWHVDLMSSSVETDPASTAQNSVIKFTTVRTTATRPGVSTVRCISTQQMSVDLSHSQRAQTALHQPSYLNTLPKIHNSQGTWNKAAQMVTVGCVCQICPLRDNFQVNFTLPKEEQRNRRVNVLNDKRFKASVCLRVFLLSQQWYSPDQSSRTPNDLWHSSRIYLEGGSKYRCECEIEFWSLLVSLKVKVGIHVYTVYAAYQKNLIHFIVSLGENWGNLLASMS